MLMMALQKVRYQYDFEEDEGDVAKQEEDAGEGNGKGEGEGAGEGEGERRGYLAPPTGPMPMGFLGKFQHNQKQMPRYTFANMRKCS